MMGNAAGSASGMWRRALVALLATVTLVSGAAGPAQAADLVGPTISNLTVTPPAAKRLVPMTVTATIADASGVAGGEVMLDAAVAHPVLPADGAWGGTTEQVTISLNNVVDIVAGHDDTCALLQDGTVECWGVNTYGQLGDGTTTTRTVPTPVSGLSGVQSLSIRGFTSCAVRTDNTVWCWGDNSSGQLGDGTTTDRSTPVQVSGLLDAVSVAVGGGHACAVRLTGHIACWGNNTLGQLGDGGIANQATPVEVVGITTAQQVSAAEDHTCAIVADYLPLCWGANDWLQVGDGLSLAPHRTPTELNAVQDAATAMSIFTGFQTTCIRRLDYSGNCWGNPFSGLTSYGVLQNVRQFSVGAITCAAMGIGNIDCWGSGVSPVFVIPGDIWGTWTVAVGSSHACAQLYDQSIVCWGANNVGQLGRGFTSTEEAVGKVPGLNGLQSQEPGEHSICVRGTDTSGNVTDFPNWACTTITILPETDPALVDLTISGVTLSPAFATDETSYAGEVDTYSPSVDLTVTPRDWRASMAYRVGSGSWIAIGSRTPSDAFTIPVGGTTVEVRVTAEDGVTDQTYSVAVARATPDTTGPAVATPVLTPSTITHGGSFTVTSSATDPSGVTAAQLRLDSGAWTAMPFTSGVPGDASVTLGTTFTSPVSVSVGEEHACALLANGTVRCWGRGDSGQLGNGIATGTAFPTLADVEGVTQVAAGRWHTCAILADTTVQCWGNNEYGQLGDNSTTNRPSPVTVYGVGGTGTLSGVTAIAAGGYHTCALLNTGAVACWGRGDYAEIGEGSAGGFLVPVLAASVSTAVAIAAGDVHTCAVLSNGTVDCWGAGNNGRLGTGLYDWAWTPTPVVDIDNAVAIAAGGSHTCAVLATGALSCWGSNAVGQLALDPAVTPETIVPITVPGVTGVKAVTAGFRDTCVLRTSGTASCWGQVASGAPGTGGLTGVTSIGIGGAAACSTLTSGSIACWGTNDMGELGDGTTTSSATAVVSTPGTAALADGTHQVCLRATDGHDNVTTPAACATLTIPDTTAPAFTTAVTVTPRAGVALPSAAATSAIPVVVSWAATDSVGVTGYTLERRTGTGAWTKVTLASATATSYATTVPSSGTVAFRVTARDAAGHATLSTSAALSARLVQQTSTAIVRRGTWTSYSLATLSGGSDRWARTAGASATFTFTGRSIGFVSMRGTGRGSVTIVVDGKTAATVSLYRSSAQPRYIAWSRAWATSGTHTVRLIVAGTAGRPRVDLDAFITVK